MTGTAVEDPDGTLKKMMALSDVDALNETYEKLFFEEKEYIKTYLNANKKNLAEKYGLTLTASRIDIVASYYANHMMDIEKAIKKIKTFYDDIKKIELYFFKNHDINIVMEDDAVDFIIDQFEKSTHDLGELYEKLSADFEYGLKLVREKTGKHRFFITKYALMNPEAFISNLIKDELSLPAVNPGDREKLK